MSRLSSPRYQILAIDVDGTLLDRDGQLRDTTIEAVARAVEAGIRPVLCTGRRYRRARPVAERLGLNAPLVCNSGALIKDPTTHETLWRADLPPVWVGEALHFLESRGEPSVTFTDDDPAGPDFRVERFPTGRELFDDYVEQNREHAQIEPGWMRNLGGLERHFHLCAIGDRPAMLDLERAIHREQAGRFRTFVQRSPRYLGTMCELLHQNASKWSAILHLANHWGIEPSAICAVGDDQNDLPMIAGAGLGVAMGHAPAEIRRAADLVTGDHDQDGVSSLIDTVLLR